MDSGTTAETIVLLIHGTFAYEASDVGSAWWQVGGGFERFMVNAFGADYAVQLPDEIFKWSGENLESVRRAAAAEFCRRIAAYERAGRRYAFVAHSHGGSVVFDALVAAHGQFPGLPNLVRWVSVGTPYLRYRADRSVWWLLAPTALLAASLAILIPAQRDVVAAHWLEYLTEPRWLEIAVPAGSLLALVYATAVLGIYLIRCARSQRAEGALDSRRKTAYEQLRDRHVTLVSPDDEAVNGLGATLHFEGELVVRPRKWWGLAFSFLLAPLADEFIWRHLAKRAQGNDLAGLRLAAVLPVPVEGVAAPRIDAALTTELTQSADARLAGVAGLFRRALYSIAFGGRSIEYLRQSALSAGIAASLVHTTYFDDPGLRSAIASGVTAGLGSDSSGAIVGSEDPLAGRTGLVMGGLSAALCTAVLIVSVLCYAVLRPLAPAALVEAALTRLPFADVVQSGGRDEAYRLFEDVMRSNLVPKPDYMGTVVELPDESRRAWASWAVTDADRGMIKLARSTLARLSQEKSQPSLPSGVAGPLPAITPSDLAVARGWGHASPGNEAEEYVALFDPAVRTQVVAALAAGMREAGNRDGFFAWLPVVDDPIAQADLLDAAYPPLCIMPTEVRSLKADSDVAASVLLNRLRCGERVNVAAELETIDSAPARVRAGVGVARILSAQDRNAAVQLLAAEQAGFPKYRRHALNGRAVLLVQYAEAWLDLGRNDDALKLIGEMEGMAEDAYEGGTVQDKSPARRALVWARLGDKERAIRWWDKLPEGRGAMEEKLDVLRRMTAHLVRRSVPLYMKDFPSHRKDFQAWYQAVWVFQSFGEFDSHAELLTSLRLEARMLQSIEFKVGRILDPTLRSKAYAALGDLLLNLGLLRPALNAIERAQPADQVVPLRHAVAKYLLGRPDG